MSAFVHLHLHSEYSLVDSTVRIPALIESCRADNMPAVALTDKNNLFALVKFYRKAIAAGVKPIVGVDLSILNPDDPQKPFSLVLLCQHREGYRRLSELVSRARSLIEQRFDIDKNTDQLRETFRSVTNLESKYGVARSDYPALSVASGRVA